MNRRRLCTILIRHFSRETPLRADTQYFAEVYEAFTTRPVIDFSEFQFLIQSLGFWRSQNTIASCFQNYSASEIRKHDFVDAIQEITKQPLNEEDVSVIWKMFENGTNRDSLKNISRWIPLISDNEDAVMNFDEFVEYMMQSQFVGCRVLTGLDTIFTLGGPGCGKGTRANLLRQACGENLDSISSGDLLREQVEKETPLAVRVNLKERLSQGLLVSSKLLTTLLHAQLAKRRMGVHTILDGYPRSVYNFQNFIEACGRPHFVLDFQCPDDLMISRIANRSAMQPGRSDDSLDIAKQRVQVYHENYSKVVHEIKKLDIKIYHINTEMEAADNVKQMCEDIPLFHKLSAAHSQHMKGQAN